MKIKILLLVIILSFSLQELCNYEGQIGACISTSACKSRSGTSHKGLCKGNKTIQCCTGIKCQNGMCGKAGTCHGKEVSNKCPGPSNFKCCTDGTPDIPKYDDDRKGNSKSQKIVDTARSTVGKYIYSFGAGKESGPSRGSKMRDGKLCDDRGILGFDCAGLARYAVYQGTGAHLNSSCKWQYLIGIKEKRVVPIANKQPGDLIFFGTGKQAKHVAIYVGNNRMVEAYGHDNKCKGLPLQETTVRKGLLEFAVRYW